MCFVVFKRIFLLQQKESSSFWLFTKARKRATHYPTRPPIELKHSLTRIVFPTIYTYLCLPFDTLAHARTLLYI